MKTISIGAVLWLFICVSMNGIQGWIVFAILFLLGFIISVIKDEIIYRHHIKDSYESTERDFND